MENLEEICKFAVDKFGMEKQTWQAIEEMGELISAINHYNRNRADLKDVCTEIADVQIMMEQLAIIYGKEDVASERKYKLERLKERLK